VTVKELIEQLQQFDPNLEVIVETCYEPDLSSIGEVYILNDKLDKETYGKVFISSDS